MKFGKSISCILILSQFALGGSVFADTTATSQATPEMNLLSTAIAKSGQQKLPADLVRAEMAEALRQYDATAPVAGRAERTEQALVALNIMSPAQARAFEEQTTTAAQVISRIHFNSAQAEQNAIQAELMNAVAGSSGAQFSACEGAYLAFMGSWAVGISAGIAGMVGNTTRYNGIFIAAFAVGLASWAVGYSLQASGSC